ncbi:MAG: hypothetical protein KAQ71_13930, partial [Desulfobulbaceae bacterium]|nr:hypothetical protein [Desulfobulbaceae bacterium]
MASISAVVLGKKPVHFCKSKSTGFFQHNRPAIFCLPRAGFGDRLWRSVGLKTLLWSRNRTYNTRVISTVLY